MSSYQERRGMILRDRAASDWLKAAVEALDKRDPIDAINDVEALKELCDLRWARLNA